MPSAVVALRALSPGSEAVLRATLAEVAGRDHMAYPGIWLSFSVEGAPHVAPFTAYGIGACDTTPAEWRFEAPAFVAPGTPVTITAHAGQPLTCDDPGGCVPVHSLSIERVLAQP